MSKRYKMLKKLGEGAQGIIMKAEILQPPPDYDVKISGELPKYVAMKKMKIVDFGQGISIESIREIKIMRELKHPNIMNIIDIFGRNDQIIMIMPLMNQGDLEELIRDQNIVLSEANIKSYMIMLLNGVNYIHSKYILHRDLKPSNCLINGNNELLVSDFGLAREYGSINRPLSHQACTIWYRSPELLYGSTFYSIGLDIWSIGCIFAELITRVPIFPGKNEIDQLIKIFRILGTPNISEWKNVILLPKYRKFKNHDKYDLKKIFKAANNNAINLFQLFCKLNPNKRINTFDALKHEFFLENPQPTPINLLPRLNKG